MCSPVRRYPFPVWAMASVVKRIWGKRLALSVFSAFARTRAFSGSDSPFTPPSPRITSKESTSATSSPATGSVPDQFTRACHRVIAMVRR
ncbi:Uncharacterised protein [Mycobacterium tuberculosis]|nr:Uncharacterised protein [Mycobacterium tuberculosis]